MIEKKNPPFLILVKEVMRAEDTINSNKIPITYCANHRDFVNPRK